jgi:hypothetical protein
MVLSQPNQDVERDYMFGHCKACHNLAHPALHPLLLFAIVGFNLFPMRENGSAFISRQVFYLIVALHYKRGSYVAVDGLAVYLLDFFVDTLKGESKKAGKPCPH